MCENHTMTQHTNRSRHLKFWIAQPANLSINVWRRNPNAFPYSMSDIMGA